MQAALGMCRSQMGGPHPGCNNYGLFSFESQSRGSSVTPGLPRSPGMLPLSLINFIPWFSSLSFPTVTLYSILTTPTQTPESFAGPPHVNRESLTALPAWWEPGHCGSTVFFSVITLFSKSLMGRNPNHPAFCFNLSLY